MPAHSRSKSESEDDGEKGLITIATLSGVDLEIGSDGINTEADIREQGEYSEA